MTRKITWAAAAISPGLQDKLTMGSLDGRRDWGYAPEYVEGMWRMLQQDEPDDFVLATGKDHSVQDFLDAAFAAVNLHWADYYESDPRFTRPAEVNQLIGDPAKAKQRLGWQAKTGLEGLVAIMVQHDLLE